uniref:NADH dehydrogenase subunit 2 n=1 Tax=Ptosima chinensis TaxID=3025998 RepID=UPI0023AAF101|nr:NADH dehydrogenase subunit 2 [Ptosima chinensis]WCO87653.1 NADH dehydrogenase subunit 2 [Ptosima chinensis]
MFQLSKIMFAMSLITGTIIAMSSYSWLGMWIGLEINLLSIIPLMSSSKNIFASEAALKYFVTQALASSLLMFSILTATSLESTINNLTTNTMSMMIMNSSLLTKMGAAPFHFWFPEVMEGLNWNNCLIILTWQKIAPMTLLMYNMKPSTFMCMIIIFCMAVSGIIGLNQVSMRKIMAYSSINHVGWMIASMLFIETIWIYYFAIYTITSFNIIMILKYFNVFLVKQIFTAMNYDTMLKMFFIMNFMSLGGLPPFIGFLPKWMTIQALVDQKMFLVGLTMVVMTLITLFYYMRLSYSSLLLSTNELNFTPLKHQKLQWMLTLNLIVLTSLITCTLMFNWM